MKRLTGAILALFAVMLIVGCDPAPKEPDPGTPPTTTTTGTGDTK